VKVDNHDIVSLDILSLHNHLNTKIGSCSIEVSTWIMKAAVDFEKNEIAANNAKNEIAKLQAAAKKTK